MRTQIQRIRAIAAGRHSEGDHSPLRSSNKSVESADDEDEDEEEDGESSEDEDDEYGSNDEEGEDDNEE